MDLQSDGYNDLYQKMNHQELSFFRVRTREKSDTTDISQIQHILHLPYEKKSFASNMRFSCLGMPCLYLGTTSYVCSRECEWNPEKEDLFAAAFIPNEQGDRLQLSMLKLFPLVIATSYRVLETGRTLKYECLISQALMKVISTMNIDGIAYLSMKGKDEFQYPQGVNWLYQLLIYQKATLIANIVKCLMLHHLYYLILRLQMVKILLWLRLM
ncbi:hypothetical protein [Blautia argi]|uniref:RES domain-containing protein n=1 Tax=Blautia argi TaxID=1912897 RepID=A0A2Z4U8G3_9FIRM|nr:hypothetical protein [Blautia argi]AWY97293.1 hypothetical protein DQQ01_03005 [Blautia argi]